MPFLKVDCFHTMQNLPGDHRHCMATPLSRLSPALKSYCLELGLIKLACQVQTPLFPSLWSVDQSLQEHIVPTLICIQHKQGCALIKILSVLVPSGAHCSHPHLHTTYKQGCPLKILSPPSITITCSLVHCSHPHLHTTGHINKGVH